MKEKNYNVSRETLKRSTKGKRIIKLDILITIEKDNELIKISTIKIPMTQFKRELHKLLKSKEYYERKSGIVSLSFDKNDNEYVTGGYLLNIEDMLITIFIALENINCLNNITNIVYKNVNVVYNHIIEGGIIK